MLFFLGGGKKKKKVFRWGGKERAPIFVMPEREAKKLLILEIR